MIEYDELISLLKEYRGGNPYHSYKNYDEWWKDILKKYKKDKEQWKFNVKDIREWNNDKNY